MINFLAPELLHRLKNCRSEHVVKALGRKHCGLRILDTTVGLGRDALILASAGNSVLGLEQNQEVYALLQRELERLRSGSRSKTKSLHLDITFKHCNSIDYLKNTTELFDIIYLDPMFPKSSKSRLVKKEMVWLKSIVGEDDNGVELFNMAMQEASATSRVIIKRPVHGPFINGIKPNYQILGDVNRFDVYKS